MSAIAHSAAFAPAAVARVGAARRLPLRSSAPRGFRLPAHVGGVKMMATLLESGEMKLTQEECEMLKLPTTP